MYAKLVHMPFTSPPKYWLLGLLPTLSCTDEKAAVEAPVEIQEPAYLDGEMLEGIPLARRLSIDNRGQFLDWDEIQMLESSPHNLIC